MHNGQAPTEAPSRDSGPDAAPRRMRGPSVTSTVTPGPASLSSKRRPLEARQQAAQSAAREYASGARSASRGERERTAESQRTPHTDGDAVARTSPRAPGSYSSASPATFAHDDTTIVASPSAATSATRIPTASDMPNGEEYGEIRRVLYGDDWMRAAVEQQAQAAPAMLSEANATISEVLQSGEVSDASDSDTEHAARAMAVMPGLHRWENDEEVSECRRCSRRFTLFLRKHHCRKCGRIFCDACTTHREHLAIHELVVDPNMPEMLSAELEGPSRVCDFCTREPQTAAPAPAHVAPLDQVQGGLAGSPPADRSLLTNVLDFVYRTRERLAEVSGGADAQDDRESLGSSASILDECPVCDRPLTSLRRAQREQHIQACLEGGQAQRALNQRNYLAYTLTEDSPVLGRECIICMEEFGVGTVVARPHCLCCFHRTCLDQWLKKGHGCPVHANET